MDLLEIERRLKALVLRFTGNIEQKRIAMILEDIGYGEPGIALENYCTNLYDNEVNVPDDIIKELRTLGTAMRLDPDYWESLRRPS